MASNAYGSTTGQVRAAHEAGRVPGSTSSLTVVPLRRARWGTQSDTDFRRTWDKDEYARRAAEREQEKAEQEDEKSRRTCP